MVTLSFDVTALFIGLIIGIFVGAFVTLYVMMKNGGSWSSGFNDGCHLECIVERLENLVETKKGA